MGWGGVGWGGVGWGKVGWGGVGWGGHVRPPKPSRQPDMCQVHEKRLSCFSLVPGLTPMTGFKKLANFNETFNVLKFLGPIETLTIS